MSTETWVQQYRAPRDPGPDGQPTRSRPRRDEAITWRAWGERTTKRPDIGLTQEWRKVR